ncbi:DsbA family protein [Rhizobium sp. BG4]|uniref:DsbA family protein n=1 Tax=Rhizobium sp. BG4 TaxID=2613770 RepID=UPI0032B2AD3A
MNLKLLEVVGFVRFAIKEEFGMKRRELLAGVATMVTLASVPLDVALAAAEDDLMTPGPLPEKAFGDEKAPVTVVEYLSMTCPHCRNFHTEMWPEIKKQYVDTGKVRFIFREFPFDPRSTAAFMLARCVGEDKWYPAVDLLFRQQEKWAAAQDGRQALQSTMAITGMGQKEFESCLTDQALLDKVSAVANKGKALGVDSTPTFFINGKKYAGALPVAEFAKIVDPLLPAE